MQAVHITSHIIYIVITYDVRPNRQEAGVLGLRQFTLAPNLEYPYYISPIDFGAEYYADE